MSITTFGVAVAVNARIGILGNISRKLIEAEHERLNEARKAFTKPFESLMAKLKKKNKVMDLTRALFEYLVDLNVPNKLEEHFSEKPGKGD